MCDENTSVLSRCRRGDWYILFAMFVKSCSMLLALRHLEEY